MPPSEQPASTAPDITQQYQTISPNTGMQPMPPPNSNMGVMAPAAPVASQPLAPRSTTSLKRPQNADGRLFINPYPLRNSHVYGEPSELTGNSVEQAMVEESRMLRPLQLGGGMTTGAQPERVPRAPADNVQARQVGALPMKGMTPMVGGEPAALPGMGMPSQATPIGGFSQAVGFGRDLPLALALSQVIPDGFTHSYAANVDPGMTVSWEGGKPWNQVLNEMLAQKGLSASIIGNQVTIQSSFPS